MKNSVQLRKERAKVVHDMRRMVDVAENEKRDMSPDEDGNYKKMEEALDSLDKRIARLESLEREEDESKDENADAGSDDNTNGGEENSRDDEEQNSKRYRGNNRIAEHRSVWETGNKKPADKRATAEYKNQWLCELVPELRRSPIARQEYRDVTIAGTGQYMATPVKVSEQFVQVLNNLVFMRDLATIETVDTAISLGVRQMTTQPSSASWSSEIAQTTPDTSMVFGQRELSPQLLSKLINVSLRTLQIVKDAEKIFMERLAYLSAIAQENAYLNGSGSGQPLGVFTASSSGVPTSQDVVSSVALAKLFTADDVINTYYSIPQQYRKSPSWGVLGHRSFFSQCRRLKDSIGNYLITMQNGGGLEKDRGEFLIDTKTYQSEYAPASLINDEGGPTASGYVCCFGDFKFYTIAEVESPTNGYVEVQRLVERFADYHEIGLLSRYWGDGSPVLPQAFARLQLAAS